MAIKEKITLKNYFRQGDIPTEDNYSDLIDSLMGITGSTVGNINITGSITASGGISSSGTGSFEHMRIPAGGRIQFDDFEDNDQYITGQDNNIVLNGHHFVKIDADTAVQIRESGLMVNDNITPASTLQVNGDFWASGSEGHITASGNISASGTIKGLTGSFSRFDVSDYIYHTDDSDTYLGFTGGDTFVTHIGGGNRMMTTPTVTTFYTSVDLKGNLTASGNISASGDIVGNRLYVHDLAIVKDGTGNISIGTNNLKAGHITASGDISSSGEFIGASANITNITASIVSASEIIGSISASNVKEISNLTAAEGAQLENIGTKTISNNQWGYLGNMNQDVRTSDAVTFATVDTGQGANELYDMNQNVTTTSDVQFSTLTLSKTGQSAGNFGEIIETVGQSFTITINNIPTIPGKDDTGKTAKTVNNTITNDSIKTTSVILITSQQDLSAVAFRVSNGACLFSITNEDSSAFEDASAVFNFTIF